MERNYAIELVDQHGLSSTLISIVQDSHQEYLDTTPVHMRARYDSSARAHLIHRNVYFNLLTRIGERGAVRLKEYRRLKYLFVEGDPQSMALRVKRVHRYHLRSRTYPTAQIRRIADEGRLLFDDAYPHHHVVGYTESGDDANPVLERIVLTREMGASIDWWHLLWRADSQSAPIETGFDQPLLPQYQIKPKKIIEVPKEEKNRKGKDARKQGTEGQ
jgi:hypothetical protein